MTENEAIKWLKAWSATHQNENDNIRESVWTAIQALEEIPQYRAIGTVEDIQLIFQLCKDLQVMCGKFHEIGTIEEFKALKEKSVAKKPILNNPKINEFYIKEAKLCPSCHSYINNCSGDYCRDCGQKIDFGKEE